MKANQKVIILNGLARAGTNITWNVLQSHPNVISSMAEINCVVGKRSNKKIYFSLIKSLNAVGLGKTFTSKVIAREFINRKALNLEDDDNKFKNEFDLYSRDEIEQATLCLKGVNKPSLWDMQYSDLIHQSFATTYFVYLIRHGHAVCESWIRRGITAKKAGYYYSRFFHEVLQQNSLYEHAHVLRFEDLLSDPFAISEVLFKFANEVPTQLSKLRFKSKNIIHQDNSYGAAYGQLNSKYWFSGEDIYNFLLTDIGARHQDRLSVSDRKSFDLQAKEALRYFNYDH